MKENQIRELVNELRDIAVEYHGTQQLRERIARTVRAALLQGSQPVSNRDELPAMQFKPVADLYGITSPTGSETTFTLGAGEASSFAKGGWSVQEYVELERYQKAVAGNSPVIPDGWIPVSERMPADGDIASTLRAAIAAAPQEVKGE
ncbi:hypothetical protein EU727_08725 [Salmonella enterica]|nr:hypothetical protein [Salmonella enterica]